MAYVTKYRGEFADIENDIVVSWLPNNTTTGAGWTTFSMSGGVLLAVSAGAASGTVAPTFVAKSGVTYLLRLTAYVLKSGATPTVSLSIGGATESNVENVADGTIELTATASGTASIEFNAAAATDIEVEILGVESEAWKIEILEDGFTGSITEMKMAGYPLEISYPSTSDDIHEQNIRGSAVSISVMAETNFAYSELFTSDNFEFKINIYYNSTLYWTGWVTANTWQEPYADVPYPVTISGTDGLGLLKNIDFTDLSLSGRQTHAKIIYDTLGEIGFTTFDEFINVYESTMTATTSASPLDQVGADTELWEEATLYDALTDILKMYNAAIIQKAAIPTIYRYKELEDATMDGRRFTAATTKSDITNTPVQYFNRSAQASNFIDHNGTLTMVPQVKEFLITQDYGSRESILSTHEFNYEDFSGSGTSWDVSDWSENSTPNPRPIRLNTLMRGENVGVYLHSVKRTGGATGPNISQSETTISSATDGFVVEFDWALFNNSASSKTLRVDVEISIVESGTTYYFDGTQWTTISSTVPQSGNILTIGVGKWTGWTNYKATINTSKAGDLEVKLYCVTESGGATSVYSGFKNVKIQFSNSDGIITDNIQYSITNAINGQTIELEYNLGDGDPNLDNVLVMQKGAVNVYSGATAVATSGSWSTRGGAEADPIIELVGGEIGNQFSRSKHLLDVSLFELNNDSINLVGRFEDVLNQYSGSNRKFVISDAMLDAKRRLWRLSLSELI